MTEFGPTEFGPTEFGQLSLAQTEFGRLFDFLRSANLTFCEVQP